VGVLTPIPAHGIVLGGNNYEEINSQSIRIQRVDLDELISKLNVEKFDLYPFMLTLTDPIDKNLTSNLILPVSDSEKNYGYAFQWFAFALTLLIIFVVLRKKKK
jgi:surfeit locus 1 family protein